MSPSIIILSSILYLLILFYIAWWKENKDSSSQKSSSSSWTYALSLTVYCTAWTFYGSIGKASVSGIDFLAIYLGPTLGAILFTPILGKMVKISRSLNLRTLADFISARYGRSFSLAGLVSMICLFSVIPYISLQLKAIAMSINVLSPELSQGEYSRIIELSPSMYISILIILFIFLFGARTYYPDEKHTGLITAISFESFVKLVAFLSAGIYIVYFVFDGIEDISTRAIDAGYKNLMSLESSSSYTTWFGLMLISFLAVFLLPRQFQVAVLENTNPRHISKASWRFPLYLLLINLLVLPIALAGLILYHSSAVSPDTYILSIPISMGQDALSLFTYIGGFSAATSMVILETIALSTMLTNNVFLPLMLDFNRFKIDAEKNYAKRIIQVRRFSIVLIILMAYIYEIYVAMEHSLVSIGLISFVGVAQLAPSLFLGMYWKRGTSKGASLAMLSGFMIWFVRLIIPTIVQAGLIPNASLGIDIGSTTSAIQGMDIIVSTTFWSLAINTFVYFFISFIFPAREVESINAEWYVDINNFSSQAWASPMKRSKTSFGDLKKLLQTFIDPQRAENLISNYARRYDIDINKDRSDLRITRFVESILSGIIGAASARIMVSHISREEELEMKEILTILKESQQTIGLNKELSKKSQELEKASSSLRQANDQLKEMDALKDEFLSTVTHELRTPLTSIRTMAEILNDHDDLTTKEQQNFIKGIISETTRLSHLITQVLDLERYSSGQQRIVKTPGNINETVDEAIKSLQALAEEKNVQIEFKKPDTDYIVLYDHDLLLQVLVNLLSNAIKFVPVDTGEIKISLHPEDYVALYFWIEDNGNGIKDEEKNLVFDKFFQAKNQTLKKPQGTGLGLAISKRIVEMHDGIIYVENSNLGGARFIFTLPF